MGEGESRTIVWTLIASTEGWRCRATDPRGEPEDSIPLEFEGKYVALQKIIQWNLSEMRDTSRQTIQQYCSMSSTNSVFSCDVESKWNPNSGRFVRIKSNYSALTCCVQRKRSKFLVFLCRNSHPSLILRVSCLRTLHDDLVTKNIWMSSDIFSMMLYTCCKSHEYTCNWFQIHRVAQIRMTVISLLSIRTIVNIIKSL